MVGVYFTGEVSWWINEGSGGVRRACPGRRSHAHTRLQSKMKVWGAVIRAGRNTPVKVRRVETEISEWLPAGDLLATYGKTQTCPKPIHRQVTTGGISVFLRKHRGTLQQNADQLRQPGGRWWKPGNKVTALKAP